MAFTKLLCLVLLFLATVQCELLPFVKPCKRTDPNLNACLLDTARQSLPYFAAGDEKYRVEPIDPFYVDKYNLQQGSGSNKLYFKLTNCSYTGLKDAKIVDARVDLEKREAHFNVFIPSFTGTNDYEISGKLLLFAVSGKGDSSCSAYEAELNTTIHYDLEKKSFGNGPVKEYIVIKSVSYDEGFKRFRCKLNNLFNGNKVLGDAFNSFLNENVFEIFKEMKPIMDREKTRLMKQRFQDIQEFFPFDELFPE